jgi:diguanylate cyclase (GGDEF)-like protein
VSRALAEADTLESGLSAALRGLGEHLGWDAALAWLVPESEDVARLTASWHDSRAAAGPFLDASRASAPRAGEGAVGRAWGTSRPDWADDLEVAARDSGDVRARAAVASGLASAAIVPIVARGEALGALELASRERRPRDADTLALLEMLATQVGQFVQRKRAEDRVAVHAAHLEAVVELSDEVSRLQDPTAVRPALCRAVLAITDSDVAAVLEPDAEGRLVITAQAGGIVKEGHEPDRDTVVWRTFRDGRGGFFTDAGVNEGPDAAFLERTGLRSIHLEPLMRDGEATGVLAVGSRSVRTETRAELGALVRLLAAETASALERTDLVAALDASARTDQLTGVANRRALDEALPRGLARARREQNPISVAMIDLDHFKAYNDTYGHPAGDRLLRSAAAGWSARLRTTDLLARYGGEEFAILLPGCSRAAAADMVGDLRGALPDGVTCSIGIATWDGAEHAEVLVARADAALYKAKRDGRDRVVSAL